MRTPNTGPTIIILGVRVKALERIPSAGDLIGLSRSSSYRMATSSTNPWPLVGPQTSRRVNMLAFAQQFGLPVRVENHCERQAEPSAVPAGISAGVSALEISATSLRDIDGR